jgi:hypothetical protein
MAVVLFRPSGTRVKFKVVHEQNFLPFLDQGWYLDKEEALKAGQVTLKKAEEKANEKPALKKAAPKPKPKG